MAATLLALHGYTLNGLSFRPHVEELLGPLAAELTVDAPTSPHLCSEEAVNRFYASTGLVRGDGPGATWWHASDDGRVYEGWETTLAALRPHFDAQRPIGVIGFSQGAMLAALLAALAGRGELLGLGFVVLVAGAIPRATALRPLFADPIRVPSLHVWGERDALCQTSAPALARAFSPEMSAECVWPGPHAFPTRGLAAEAIRSFIVKRLA
jgi:predicted esterase